MLTTLKPLCTQGTGVNVRLWFPSFPVIIFAYRLWTPLQTPTVWWRPVTVTTPKGSHKWLGWGWDIRVSYQSGLTWSHICYVPVFTSSILRRVPWTFAFSAIGDVGTPETMAPVIVVPPGNRSVVAGSSEITLECIANARYVVSHPLRIWIHYYCNEMTLVERHITMCFPSSSGDLVGPPSLHEQHAWEDGELNLQAWYPSTYVECTIYTGKPCFQFSCGCWQRASGSPAEFKPGVQSHG